MHEQQINVRIPRALARDLARVAARTGKRRSDIVREALARHLGGDQPRGRRPAERVAHLLGSLESGIPDLAEHHRRYVLETLARGR